MNAKRTSRVGVLRCLADSYRRLSISLFGNTIGLIPNFLYLCFGFVIFLKYRVMPRPLDPGQDCKTKDLATALSHDGFVSLGDRLDPAIVESIREKVSSLTSDGLKLDQSLSEAGLSRIVGFLEEAPELEEIFSDPVVKGVIETYYGSDFRIYNSDFYRTFYPDTTEEKAKEVFNSLSWHCDNLPSSLIKIFVYLTDVEKDTGAINILSKGPSQKMIKDGFSRYDYERFEREIDKKSVELEGRRGTILLFSTHYCLHRAALPVRGHRDVGVFMVQPALKPYSRLNAEERRLVCRRQGYCVNPFTNKALRMEE